MPKPYLVREGVECIDGRRVPVNRVVQLDDAAARFDLDHGNIVPTGAPKLVRKDTGDGGN
jgi:hypothetical protein